MAPVAELISISHNIGIKSYGQNVGEKLKYLFQYTQLTNSYRKMEICLLEAIKDLQIFFILSTFLYFTTLSFYGL